MERGVNRWKGGGKMEWRLTRWNGEEPDGTERDQMGRRGTRWNGDGLDGTERNQMERKGTRLSGG